MMHRVCLICMSLTPPMKATGEDPPPPECKHHAAQVVYNSDSEAEMLSTIAQVCEETPDDPAIRERAMELIFDITTSDTADEPAAAPDRSEPLIYDERPRGTWGNLQLALVCSFVLALCIVGAMMTVTETRHKEENQTTRACIQSGGTWVGTNCIHPEGDRTR